MIKLFKSLRSQLMIRFLLIMVVICGIVEVNEYQSLKQYLYDNKSEFLDSRFRNLNGDYVVNLDTDELLNSYATYFIKEVMDQNISVVIVNRQGLPIAIRNKYTGIMNKSSDNDSLKSVPVPLKSESEYQNLLLDNKMDEYSDIVTDDTGIKQMVIYRKIGDIDNPVGLIQISTTLDDIENLLFEQIKIFTISSLIVLVLGGGIGWSILNLTLSPLLKMRQMVSQINPTKLDTRLNIKTGQLEVDELSLAFNQMMERLEWSFLEQKKNNDKMKLFMSDVSHELRTPLTSIQGFIEVLQMGAVNDEIKLNRALNSISSESQRLSKLVNQLLLLLKVDDNYKSEVKIEKLREILLEIYPQLEILGQQRHIELELLVDGVIEINSDHFKQIIYNLFQNAVKYTDETDGVIYIRLRREIHNNQFFILLEIEDNGKGISQDKLPYIFERFYRADEDRGRKTGGYGLGLSIVKSIVEQYDGKIKVKSDFSKGTVFTMIFKEVILR